MSSPLPRSSEELGGIMLPSFFVSEHTDMLENTRGFFLLGLIVDEQQHPAVSHKIAWTLHIYLVT